MLDRLWQKLRGQTRTTQSPIAATRPEEAPLAAEPAPQITRDAYIQSPLPIAEELAQLFQLDAPLVIFDIGSCEGEDSIRYARSFPNSRIYAFEPLPANMATLKRQVAAYGATQVEAFPIALSDERGTATFYVSSGAPEHLPNNENWDYGNKSSSLLPPGEVTDHHPWLKFDQAIEVKTDTLANFCDARGIDHIDLIHMDVQGAELKVLLGAGALLQQVKAIWLEIENVPLYEGQPLAPEMQAFMESQGFVKHKDTVSEISGDHLYVRKDPAA
ncbi:FkbM family methyltransferase [Cupriavidus sp. SIMBA_020]|uniref:FkbM family methyltransferase n=1 Tax=Cupriavidus sp. SIMBA_020 TaxID=3085766 RepID=UPI0039787DCB